MPGIPTYTAFDPLPPTWSTAQLDTNFNNTSALLASSNNYNTYLVDTGAVNAYVVQFAAGITCTLTAGLVVQFKATNANTGASTLNVNGLGAKAIVRGTGIALLSGDIAAGAVVQVQYDGTSFQLQTLSTISQVQPTRTILTSGSGTYTTPANAKRLVGRMVGGGGGGAASNNTGNFDGTIGGNTTFSTFAANGGNPGRSAGGGGASAGGAGGTATGGTLNLTGVAGGAGVFNAAVAGMAGGTPFGATPAQVASNINGNAGTANTGCGGNGASETVNPAGGGAGGCGGYCEWQINNPAATYSYAVGAGGAGSIGGNFTGGAGGSGLIIIDEYYF